MFFGLFTGIVSTSNYTKYVSLSNQTCMIQSFLIYLHPNSYSQELRYYPFADNLDRCDGYCRSLNS